MPAGFVKKKRAMSTSATTRSDVPARNRYSSQLAAGVSTAKAIALKVRSVTANVRHAERKSPAASAKSVRTVCGMLLSWNGSSGQDCDITAMSSARLQILRGVARRSPLCVVRYPRLGCSLEWQGGA